MPDSKTSKARERRRAPALTIESMENELIADAVKLAQKQIKAGTASSQVITHFLKLGTTREQLEKKRLEQEIKLKEAQTKSLNEIRDMRELAEQAIQAIKTYRGIDE